MDRQCGSGHNPQQGQKCLDPKDLNKAVICPKYQIPTLEELLPKFIKAKVFGTLDAKDGFYQVELDEYSGLKTTFWTPLVDISTKDSHLE